MSKTTITENDVRLTAYAVGEMDAEEQQQFERLLADSPEAQAEVQAIRALSENLSTEFERELDAVDGQQPLASVPDPVGAESADSEDSGNVLRPRFWVFGSVAAGLAATVMVAVFSLQDTSFDRQGLSSDKALAAVLVESGAGDANATVELSEADVSELHDDDAGGSPNMMLATVSDREDAKYSRRAQDGLKGDVSDPAQFENKADGSLALAPAKEATPGKKMKNKDGELRENTSLGRSVITLPYADSPELPANLAKVKRGDGGAEATFAIAGTESRAEGEEMKAAPGSSLSASGSAVGGVITPAAPATPAPMLTAASTAARGGTAGRDAAPAPNELYYRQRSKASAVTQPEPASGAVGGNPLTEGLRSGGHAVDEATIDALIDAAKAGEAAPADNFRSVPQRGYAGQRGGDRHAALIDNSFKDPLDEELSTFSIDVDTASYAQLRRSLLRDGQWPHPNEVRIEELINYFDYDYPAPDWDEVKAGDAAPFAVSLESAPAPWAPKHRLVSIGLKSAELSEQRPAANLVFLLDVSGSMNNADKLPLLQKALKALVPQLRAEDSVTMVAYAGRAGEVLPPTPGDDQDTILAAIDALSAGGSTNGAGGITLAYQRARERFVDGGVNRVILATDGDFNVGVSNDDALVRLVEKQAQTDVFLTVLGFGSGNLNDSMMEKITNKGNGNYFYIDGVPEAKKVLVEQMAGTLVTVAKDVKIQVDFNPGKVAAYRLIGYANRMLKREDFDNDKIDAGEIGAGHTVTALYEVVPVGVAMELTDKDVEGLKYQKRLQEAAKQDLEEKRQGELADRGIEMVESHELLTVKLRYKQPTAKESALLEFPLVDKDLIPGRKPALRLASADFQFASAVAAFGMRLRNSRHISKDFSLAAIAELAAGVADVEDENESKRRKEFVKMVEQAAGDEPSPSDGVRRKVQERLQKLR